MLPTSASLQTSDTTSFGDTSRSGQGSGVIGNVISFVAGKGNSGSTSATAATNGDNPLPTWAWILIAAAGVGFVVFLIQKRRRK